MEHVGGYWHVFFVFRLSPLCLCKPRSLHTCNKLPKIIGVFGLATPRGSPKTSPCLPWLVPTCCFSRPVLLKFQQWNVSLKCGNLSLTSLPNSPRHLGSQESLTSWLEIRCQKAECHDMRGVIHQVPTRFNEPSQLGNFHTSALNNENL